MAASNINQIAEALRETLISPAEIDNNWENANVVDALCKIARGLHAVARAINMQTLASVAHTAELETKIRSAVE